jgi:hypothetical protein
MPCTEVKSAKYQTRKSPAFHAGDCKGMTKKGKDGSYVSRANKRGIYTWVRLGTSRQVRLGTSLQTRKAAKGKHYDTHNNGGRPYRVYIDGSKVSIYSLRAELQENNREKLHEDKLVKSLTVKKVFVGKSTGKADGADHKPSEAKQFLGNSILLHISGKKYMFVGDKIYEFDMEDAVDSYFSKIGRNDVPYPVILGTQYVYFMLDHTYVPRSIFPVLKAEQWEDAYSYYYGFVDPVTGKQHDFKNSGKFSLEKQAKKMKGFHKI